LHLEAITMIRSVLFGFAVGLLVASAAIDLVAQSATPRPSDKAYAAPRTPWGHPDLQGIWTSDDARSVPLQRPAGDSEILPTDPSFGRRR
jgi:hypothetical protein